MTVSFSAIAAGASSAISIPPRSTSTRLQSWKMSDIECSITSNAQPAEFSNFSIWINSSCSLGLSPAAGSSRRISAGRLASRSAISNFFCSNSDSVCAGRSSFDCTLVRCSAMKECVSSLRSANSSSAISMFLRTVRPQKVEEIGNCGISRGPRCGPFGPP